MIDMKLRLLNKIRELNNKRKDGSHMVVKSTAEAWEAANKMLPTDYQKDEESSQRAGYPIYRSTEFHLYNGFHLIQRNAKKQ